MKEIYCKSCKRRINIVPFIGGKYHSFEDGTYCDKCAKLLIEKRRKKI